MQRRKKGGQGQIEIVQKPSCKVDKKAFFYLMEISVHNSYILFKEKTGSIVKLLDFQISLIKMLCRQLLCDNKVSDALDNNASPPKTPKHNPASCLKGGFNSCYICTLSATGTKKYPQRKCRLCTKNGRRKDTR